jgi:hypothetical protein
MVMLEISGSTAVSNICNKRQDGRPSMHCKTYFVQQFRNVIIGRQVISEVSIFRSDSDELQTVSTQGWSCVPYERTILCDREQAEDG